MPEQVNKVVVVGAGPVGLLTALMLGRAGITVEVLEAESYVDTRPRGIAYGPAAVKVLRRAGVLEQIEQQGFYYHSFSWRDIDGNYLLGGDSISGKGEDGTVVLPVGILSVLLLDEIKKESNITVSFNHSVTDVGQNESEAWVDTTLQDGSSKRVTGNFIVGADGGQSKVRKSVSGRAFHGFTWPLQMVAVNVRYDFFKHGWSDVQWVIDPVDWAMISKLDQEGSFWRVAYGEDDKASLEELKERIPARLEKLIPGHPKAGDYTIEGTPANYHIHNRLAEQMRVGRVLLAGDAAHLNNPMGGLGLTTGICDVGNLVEGILHIRDGGSLDILDRYDSVRRSVFQNITNPTSIHNLYRFKSRAEDVVAIDPVFKHVKDSQQNPELAVQIYQQSLQIGGDLIDSAA